MKKNTTRIIPTLLLGATLATLGLGGLTTPKIANASTTSSPLVVQTASGLVHNLALTNDGKVLSWGDNWYRQLGPRAITNNNNPQYVSGLSGVSQVFAGGWQSFALMNDGTVEAWGNNVYGQLGLGTSYKGVPATIPGLTGVKDILSFNHTLALINDGTVKAWGYNGSGGLGIGNTTNQLSPVTIPGLSNVKQVALGNSFSVALLNDGTVKAWGDNYYGELGIGSSDRVAHPTPITVPGLNGVKQISSCSYGTLALMNDGTVKFWGEMNSVQHNSPVTIPGLSGVQKLFSGGDTGFAVMSDGTIKVFGNNSVGQFGNGSTNSSNSAVSSSGLTGVVKLSVGSMDVLALTTDGKVESWGDDRYGELGIGYATQHVPFGITKPSILSLQCDPNVQVPLANSNPNSALFDSINNLTNSLSSLNSQDAITTALQQYNTVKQQVDALPDGTDKTALENQLSSDLNLINTAQATLDMNSAQTMANALSTANPLTQQAITSAQTALDKANSEVSALASSTTKTNLQTEGQAVQETISEAQATLDMNSAKTLADGLSGNLSQDAISTAQSALTKANTEVSALASSTAKTNLQTEGQAVQETINEAQATLDMNSAKTLADGLSGNLSQDAISTAQSALDKANAEVSALADGTVKANLQAEAPAIQETINVAQATLDVQNAETSIDQNDVNTAQTAVAKLADGDIKTALEARIITVQDVINATDATVNAEATLATLNTTLATENLSPNGQPQKDTLVSQLQSELTALEQQSAQATTIINSIPNTTTSALNSRITDLKSRIAVVNGYANSIQQILKELQFNPNKANGTLKDTTVNVELNSNTDLNSHFASALMTQLGTTFNLKWISIDNTLGTVDGNGMFTASHNGVAKVTAYNEKGIVDIIVKISNRTVK